MKKLLFTLINSRDTRVVVPAQPGATRTELEKKLAEANRAMARFKLASGKLKYFDKDEALKGGLSDKDAAAVRGYLAQLQPGS